MTDTRSFEMTLEIAVRADAVWQALTDAKDLVRWFPTVAHITPGKGGRWAISWDGNWPWSTEIEIWEPDRRLRLVDRHARPYDANGVAVNESATPMPIAIDWYIEGKGGSTTVRLVHSGFGRGRAWDDEYEGVSLGWPLELNGLKHYLERHRGQERRVAWSRTVVAATPEAVWRRIVGADGLLREGSLTAADGRALRPGDRYAATLATGDRLEGSVVLNLPGRGVEVTVDGWDDALYRIWIDRAGDESAVNSWLSTYGMPASFTNGFDARMRAEIDRLAAVAAAMA